MAHLLGEWKIRIKLPKFAFRNFEFKTYCSFFYFDLSSEEAQEYINIGAINSLFVLGRSIGFIGHYMDQKRLKQGLYRHPWDDISYVLPEQFN